MGVQSDLKLHWLHIQCHRKCCALAHIIQQTMKAIIHVVQNIWTFIYLPYTLKFEQIHLITMICAELANSVNTDQTVPL